MLHLHQEDLENYDTNNVQDKLNLVSSYTAYHPVLLTTYDIFTIKYGSADAVTVTLTSDEIGAAGFLAGVTAAATLTSQLAADWSAKYLVKCLRIIHSGQHQVRLR